MDYQEHFESALKKGQKEYAKNKAEGVSGHLPSLEGLLKDIEIVSSVQLGTVEIPLKKLIGSYSNSRRIAFAKNFMPLSAGVEFKSKWVAVCEAHLTEGLREPVKVYEYMNWYYVMEGNKRVSVLKYFNAYSVMAEVTRLIPKKNIEDENTEKYYAFLELNKMSGFIDLWFSKASRFYRFMDGLSRYEPTLNLYKDKYKHFDSYVFQPFRRLYKAAGGDALSCTTGDAFLEYARVYGFEQQIDEEKQLAPIRHLVEELHAKALDQRSFITEEFEEPAKSGFISSLTNLLKPKKKLKIGFVHARNVNDSGWTLAHDLGRIEMEKALSEDVETYVVYDVPESPMAYNHIQNLVDLGMDVIFTTSAIFRKQTLRCALENPSVLFFNCSESRPYLHLSNYYGKTYEPKYLMGLLAGIYTKTNEIGYLATVPDSENLASINAFSIGVRTVNQQARVHVAYTSSWNSQMRNDQAQGQLLEKGVDLIANKVIFEEESLTKHLTDRGVFAYLASYSQEGWEPLAAAFWEWGVYYERIVSSIVNRSYEDVVRNFGASNQLINFYWGMSTGVLDLWLSPKIPKQTSMLVRQMKRLLVSESMSPFDGPLYDKTNLLVCPDEETLEPAQIINMTWIYENVHIIPYQNELMIE